MNVKNISFQSTWRAAHMTLFAAFLLCPGTAPLARAAETQPQCKVWIQGDSTLHKFESTATQVNVVMDLEAFGAGRGKESLDDRILNGKTGKLEISILVNGMKSGNRQLDKNMYKSLNAAGHPSITFSLQRYEIKGNDEEGITVQAQGALSVAGTERQTEVSAQGRLTKSGLQLFGKKELLMTDFNIKPPTFMMGTLKTDNRIAVHYEFFVSWGDLDKGRFRP